jgi:hypothetical protein
MNKFQSDATMQDFFTIWFDKEPERKKAKDSYVMTSDEKGIQAAKLSPPAPEPEKPVVKSNVKPAISGLSHMADIRAIGNVKVFH